ncbi:alpha-keto acid decarboxylase family protein [Desulfosediminicola ganghwensis]|uniref:alpha-keto acid decarboxylase family protein n=1 Tax=Desulfosediminicola ganghwensis TaxID=2569540 RepID=UPI0010ABE93F|nr:thiamine pyrophosphate-dependent enzyme [Desulfosediminicola ganghwensis]
MKLSHYLFSRLEQYGVRCTFGIPGDFALPLYAEQAAYGMQTVVCTHEPSCVFAADAYSRLKGFGAVLTTYSVGGLNMINPMAMAYAENSPVVVISGAPNVCGRKTEPSFHHLVKDYGSQHRIFKEVTCATAALNEAATAADEIDRVLTACLAEKRPGYLEIPIDMTSVEIPTPPKPSAPDQDRPVNTAAIIEAAGEISAALEKARRPVLYAGVGIRRHALMDAVRTISESWLLPVVSSVMGKGAFPESHPHFAGIYMGEMGSKLARETLEGADLILSVGVIYSDVNTGFWTAHLESSNILEIRDSEVRISHHIYPQLPIAPLMQLLASTRPDSARKPGVHLVKDKTLVTVDIDESAPLNTAALIQCLKTIDQSKFSYLADVGDAWFAGLELNADIFMAPGYYASMGFAVPGALGAAMAAPDLRPLVLVGDGAFQMTGSELSTLVAQGHKPIVLVLNNGYYKMLAALDQHRDYYNLAHWDYVAYAEALGCPGVRVQTAAQLNRALHHACTIDGPYLIEAILSREDHAPMMRRIKEYFTSLK